MTIDRRLLIAGGLAAGATPALATTPGERLAAAARKQIGVTRSYDPAYSRIGYPGGDIPLTTGVCADVIIRAARDGVGRDLQKLVHEDMRRSFAAYPSRRAWGLTRPDSNIDHRRVLNLEVFWRRARAELWLARGQVNGATFPQALQIGDVLTWRVAGERPHVGLVSKTGVVPQVIHNIGGGVEEVGLWTFALHRAVGHYRWPAA